MTQNCSRLIFCWSTIWNVKSIVVNVDVQRMYSSVYLTAGNGFGMLQDTLPCHVTRSNQSQPADISSFLCTYQSTVNMEFTAGLPRALRSVPQTIFSVSTWHRNQDSNLLWGIYNYGNPFIFVLTLVWSVRLRLSNDGRNRSATSQPPWINKIITFSTCFRCSMWAAQCSVEEEDS